MNQEGYTTSYQYDAIGNLLETTNPDGTTQQYVFNALGEVTSSTEPTATRSLTPTTRTASSRPRTCPTARRTPTPMTPRQHAHGRRPRRGLVVHLQQPGPADDYRRALRHAHGAYGIDGNVTQIVDQTGFTTNYLYDAVGRLSELTDASGNLIESYTYDPAGNIVSEAKGNGTSTTYQYNADGDVTQITNLAPGGVDQLSDDLCLQRGRRGHLDDHRRCDDDLRVRCRRRTDFGVLARRHDPLRLRPDGNRTSMTDNGVVTNYAQRRQRVHEHQVRLTRTISTTPTAT